MGKIKHIINWNYIASIFAAVGLAVALIIYIDNSEISNLTSSIQLQDLKIQGYKDDIELLEAENKENLNEEFNKAVGFYENRIKVNNMIFQDSLLNLKNKMSNGIYLSKSRFDTIVLGLSYGAQAFDLLDLYDKRINNQKKIIGYYDEILKGKDSIIQLFQKSK